MPIAVTLNGDDVVTSYPEEADAKRVEAARLADRAVKRAREGQYRKAIDIYNRMLESQPSFDVARRDLAMCYMELGDVASRSSDRRVAPPPKVPITLSLSGKAI